MQSAVSQVYLSQVYLLNTQWLVCIDGNVSGQRDKIVSWIFWYCSVTPNCDNAVMRAVAQKYDVIDRSRSVKKQNNVLYSYKNILVPSFPTSFCLYISIVSQLLNEVFIFEWVCVHVVFSALSLVGLSLKENIMISAENKPYIALSRGVIVHLAENTVKVVIDR